MTISRLMIPCWLAWRFSAGVVGTLMTAIFWLVLVSSPVDGQTKGKTACELVTAAEIAKVLNVAAVKKDETNSGEHVMGHVDVCNWYVKENSPEGLEVRWYRAQQGVGEPLAEFIAAKGYAFEHDSAREQRAQRVTGVGDEAIYVAYPDGQGGSLAFRTPTGAAALVGSASKDGLVTLAKLAASRM